ncbi:M28 family metallopeptidase [Aliikangiella coralliicola]|uniref:M20/M25/M40 family metallo-hydrolase n=1 Tax=Aliikangiella coralliicola TaxID=2592383 RepID=A0A545UJU0_9GAMM|nr:M28 family metallopeptidase [Aliikangiella coralliicola]TQV89735.1 M20/M25/M40 family metallo-hydrolase [Aliikangiella coralliicola]
MKHLFVTFITIGSVVFLSTANGKNETQTLNSSTVSEHSIQPAEKAWISIGSDAASLINKQPESRINLQYANVHNTSDDSIVVAQIPVSQIDQLSELMHHEFNRCGGFFFHESFEQAQAFVASSAQLQPAVAVNYTIDNPQGVNALTSELSQSNLSSTVNALSNYHNRYYTQQTGTDAANWIKNTWSNIGNSRSDISVELYNHSWQQPSVIATITGTTNPNEIVVIGGHLDSINQSNPSGGRAPGADDNASGISVLTETLRAIVASGFKPQKTIKLMGYAAEEVGLRGSNAIAQSFKSNGQNVIGVVQFDMTGKKGTANKDIVFMTDYTNNGQNQFMAQLIDTYISGVSYGFDQCGYACSDHASWHNQGFAASMPFESAMNDSNRQIHTSNDTSFDPSHGIKFAKLSVAYVAELAKGSTDGNPPPPPPGDNVLENGVAKTNLSASTGNDLTFTMDVPTGATDVKFEITGGSGDADLYVKFASAPTDSSYDCRPYKNGNSETCTGNQTGGTYYVRVKAYNTFSGVSLTGSFTDGGNPPGNDPIDKTINNISVNRAQWQHYTQALSAGYSKMTVTISGGSGDADLYVRHGAQSTLSQYDCRPYKNGNSEVCTFNSPAAGTWYIDLYGYSSVSGVTLSIKATP